MKRCHGIAWMVPLVLFALGCASTVPPEPAIAARILSEPGPAEVVFRGTVMGLTPTDLAVATLDELVEIDASRDGQEASEIRMRFDDSDQVTVTFHFSDEPSAVAKALGLERVLVFDYSDRTTFDVDKADVKPGFMPRLQAQARILNDVFRSVDVYVCGHTDATGGRDHNQVLSLRRAEAVADVLRSNGVDAARLHEQGFGEDYPIADNAAADGRAQNRRTEVILPR
jgi:outer membrane protein OmpA-like peptidoglycan-associated protein